MDLSVSAEHWAMAAGLGASAVWVVSSLAFTAASRRIGPSLVNGLRILLAVAVLWTVHSLLRGTPVPGALREQIVYLALSGMIGLAIGDQLFLVSLVEMGPRIAVLVMCTAGPIFALGLGVGVMGDRLGVWDVAGIAVTIAGVAWVITERGQDEPTRVPHAEPLPESARRHSGLGMACAIGAAFCQAAGGLCSKRGMGHGILPPAEHMDPLGATAWRMAWALVFVTPIVVWSMRTNRKRVRTLDTDAEARRARVRAGVGFAVIGSIFGPCTGVWMSLVAYDGLSLGVAQTLCSLTPVMILPVVALSGRERVSMRAVLGACVAVGGSAMLFLG